LTQYASDADETAHYAPFFRHIQLLPEIPRTPLDYLQRVLLPQKRFPRRAEHAWSAPMWHAITQRVNQSRYDVIHVLGSVQVYEFFYALQGLPAVITPYEAYSLYLRRAIAQNGGMLNRARRLIAMQLERWMFTPYARTVVVAQPDKEELQRLNPELQVDVISNGIDIDFFTGRENPSEPATLLFVGNFDYPPNVQAALLLAKQIMPQVRHALPAAQLLLVGNAPPPELLALNNAFITVTGRVPDIRPYQARATVFVCPLQVGAGIKNKVLEALAMGIPVVATPVSLDGIAVTHNHSALITPITTFADEVIRLLRDGDLQHTLSQNGRQLIETHYTWEQVAAQYEAIYQQLMSENSSKTKLAPL
jgi:glycosyltransferase involved in cell wall biosynthesis